VDPDPEPALFVSGFQDADKKDEFFSLSSSKIKPQRIHKSEEIKGFLKFFLLGDGRIRIRTNIDGYGKL
jgi:hypothetical protein